MTGEVFMTAPMHLPLPLAPMGVDREFVIHPNRSLSDQGRRNFLWLLGGVMALISLGMLYHGFWLILPFMGGEFLLVVYLLRRVCRQSAVVERVRIGEGRLVITREISGSSGAWSFPLDWVRVQLRPRSPSLHGTRLLIGSHGDWIELASFLNEEERGSLAEALQAAILQVRASTVGTA
jgi:uncharacterized membrane protein